MDNKTTIKEAYARGVKDFDDGVEFGNPPKHYTPLLIELWEQGWVDRELGQEVLD